MSLKVAIIGTGFAARLRAEALQQDNRCQLVGVVGGDPERTKAFAQQFQSPVFPSPAALLSHVPADVIVVATTNQQHAAIAHQALTAGKHVVVEYPIAFSLHEARTLVTLAQSQQKLLHIEHVELLTGMHLALKTTLPRIGQVLSAETVTLKARRPAPQKWAYEPAAFGFPLVGAVSMIHRLMDLFGAVEQVSSQLQMWGPDLPTRYHSCVCRSQLRFWSGVVADVTYGKGEAIWRSQRTVAIRGENGGIFLGGTEGNVLVTEAGEQQIDVGSRRGLFAKDTVAVVDHLLEGAPLGSTPEASVRSLEVALAAEEAVRTGQIVKLSRPGDL